MNKHKYLSFEERLTIKTFLDNSASFKEIGRALGWDCTAISKEARNHLLLQKTGCFGRPFNDCANRRNCPDLSRPPYVCNGCPKRKTCTLEKHVYSPRSA